MRPTGYLALIAAVLLGLLAGCSGGAANQQAGDSGTKPQRIVSLNLCTDQLLLQMVEKDRIAALTYLAGDPRSSAMASEARGIPATSGVAEDVIALDPDLVLAGTFSTRGTVAILRRLGYRVVEFEPETDFDSIKTNIRKLANATGEEPRGAAMAARLDAALGALPSAPDHRPIYANYNANGYIPGDATLITRLANLAGFDTLPQALGRPGMQQVSLEQMLVTRPDVIDLGDFDGAPALATEMFAHPALQRLMRERRVINLPGRYTDCGSMLTLEALDALVAARRSL